MKRIKLFYGSMSSFKSLQDEVNNWIGENKNFTIDEVKINIAGSTLHDILITVVYYT